MFRLQLNLYYHTTIVEELYTLYCNDSLIAQCSPSLYKWVERNQYDTIALSYDSIRFTVNDKLKNSITKSMVKRMLILHYV